MNKQSSQSIQSLNPNKQQLPQFKQNSYRIVICLLFSLISLTNGMCWVVVSPITKEIQDAYGQSSVIVALIPMSYMISYVFINFPSNWVLDVKGIKKGIITGTVFTAIGAGIRCLANYSFQYLIIGQFLCSIGQPFILNAPTKIATRWFTPQNRSLALALLSVVNIVGTAVGFIIPTIFVQTQLDSLQMDDKSASTIRDQFWTLLIFEFCLAAVATLLNIFFFAQRPPILPRYLAHIIVFIVSAQCQSIKILFTSKKYFGILFAFSIINGAFNIYGSLLEEIVAPYGINSDQTSVLAASMMIIGIVSAALIGMYVQKTLNYRGVFRILSVLGVLQTIGFVFLLKMQADFIIYLIVILFQGILFIPTMPLFYDYGCDIMFPIGQAQITGTLMTGGQIFGIMFIVVSQQLFGLGDKEVDQKQAAFYSVVFVGVFLIFSCISRGFKSWKNRPNRSKNRIYQLSHRIDSTGQTKQKVTLNNIKNNLQSNS